MTSAPIFMDRQHFFCGASYGPTLGAADGALCTRVEPIECRSTRVCRPPTHYCTENSSKTMSVTTLPFGTWS